MSAPAEEKTRADSAIAKRKLRTGQCLACKCEKWELKEHMDGFPTCECGHTQWGHKVPEGVR